MNREKHKDTVYTQEILGRRVDIIHAKHDPYVRAPANPWWRVGVAYGVLLLFLGPWVWSGYWAACRAVLPLTIAFNLLLPANRAFWPLLILGNLSLLHAVWRFL